MARVDRRTPANVYHIMTIAELQALTPDFDWKVYLAAKKQSGLTTVNMATPKFFKALNHQIDTADMDALKSYLRWHTIHRYAANLSDPFVEENFNFYAATLAGQKELDSALEALHRIDRSRVGRGCGTGLGGKELSARGQGQHGEAGDRAREGAR